MLCVFSLSFFLLYYVLLVAFLAFLFLAFLLSCLPFLGFTMFYSVVAFLLPFSGFCFVHCFHSWKFQLFV